MCPALVAIYPKAKVVMTFDTTHPVHAGLPAKAMLNLTLFLKDAFGEEEWKWKTGKCRQQEDAWSSGTRVLVHMEYLARMGLKQVLDTMHDRLHNNTLIRRVLPCACRGHAVQHKVRYKASRMLARHRWLHHTLETDREWSSMIDIAKEWPNSAPQNMCNPTAGRYGPSRPPPGPLSSSSTSTSTSSSGPTSSTSSTSTTSMTSSTSSTSSSPPSSRAHSPARGSSAPAGDAPSQGMITAIVYAKCMRKLDPFDNNNLKCNRCKHQMLMNYSKLVRTFIVGDANCATGRGSVATSDSRTITDPQPPPEAIIAALRGRINQLESQEQMKEARIEKLMTALLQSQQAKLLSDDGTSKVNAPQVRKNMSAYGIPVTVVWFIAHSRSPKMGPTSIVLYAHNTLAGSHDLNTCMAPSALQASEQQQPAQPPAHAPLLQQQGPATEKELAEALMSVARGAPKPRKAACPAAPSS
ncbi:hypothetical protein HaLaN_28071, partial [Haematococcus lacustris]